MNQLVKTEEFSDPDSEHYNPRFEGLSDIESEDSSTLEIIWMWIYGGRKAPSLTEGGVRDSPTDVEFMGYHQDISDEVEAAGADSDPSFVSDAKSSLRRLFEAGYITMDRRQATPQYDKRSTRQRRKGAFEQEFGDLF